MYFCSEMVTKIYSDLGIVSGDVDPETISPTELVTGLNPVVRVPPVVIVRE